MHRDRGQERGEIGMSSGYRIDRVEFGRLEVTLVEVGQACRAQCLGERQDSAQLVRVRQYFDRQTAQAFAQDSGPTACRHGDDGGCPAATPANTEGTWALWLGVWWGSWWT
ncbi:hypothetical protein BSA16_00610 [Micromonospora sp. Rc5]|nr:hypothetical protein BSA16_00610 [Micromonospora sp. Rc5]